MAGLALLAIGLFTVFYQPDPFAAFFLLAGAGTLLGWAARSLGRSTNRSRYLRERWRTHDIVAAVSSLLLLGAAPLIRRLAPAALGYAPAERAVPPPFEPASIGLVLLLIVPAALALAGERRTGGHAAHHPASTRQ